MESIDTFNFEDYISKYRQNLIKYCRIITGSKWEAEDLFQETLLRLHKKFLNRKDNENVIITKAFLFRIATNAWIDHCRKNKLVLDSVPIDENSTCAIEPSVETREAIEILLENSPPRQAAIFVLVDVFEFTAKEVAVMLTITEGSVKAILHRARANIRQSRDPIPVRHHPKQTLIDRFVDAINLQNPSLIKQVLVELQDSGIHIKNVEKNEVSYFIIEDPDGNSFIVRSPKKLFINVSNTDK